MIFGKKSSWQDIQNLIKQLNALKSNSEIGTCINEKTQRLLSIFIDKRSQEATKKLKDSNYQPDYAEISGDMQKLSSCIDLDIEKIKGRITDLQTAVSILEKINTYIGRKAQKQFIEDTKKLDK